MVIPAFLTFSVDNCVLLRQNSLIPSLPTFVSKKFNSEVPIVGNKENTFSHECFFAPTAKILGLILSKTKILPPQPVKFTIRTTHHN